MQANIREILIITTPEDQDSFKKVLGDGSNFGIQISYASQSKPEGIAQAFIIAEEFIGNHEVALILGDNLFYGSALEHNLIIPMNNKGARIFTYQVANPEDYGVLNIDDEKKPISVEEKPKVPKSNLAITGLYFFDSQVVNLAKTITPSSRGELEITSIMQKYIEDENLEYVSLPTGVAWLDTGTPNSLNDAAQFVRVLEERTGRKIACLEELGFKRGWLDRETLNSRIDYYGNIDYGKYLRSIL